MKEVEDDDRNDGFKRTENRKQKTEDRRQKAEKNYLFSPVSRIQNLESSIQNPTIGFLFSRENF